MKSEMKKGLSTKDLSKNIIIFSILGIALIISLIITIVFLNDSQSNLDSQSKAAVNPTAVYFPVSDTATPTPNPNLISTTPNPACIYPANAAPAGCVWGYYSTPQESCGRTPICPTSSTTPTRGLEESPTPLPTLLPTYTPMPTYIRYTMNPFSPIPLTPTPGPTSAVKPTTGATSSVLKTLTPVTATAAPVITSIINNMPTATPEVTNTESPMITETPIATVTTKPASANTKVTSVASPLEVALVIIGILTASSVLGLGVAIIYKKFQRK